MSDLIILHVSSQMELYDPSRDIWTSVGNICYGQYWDVISVLTNEQVLIKKGADNVGLYDILTGLCTHIGNMIDRRDSFATSLLIDGRILLTGGAYANGTVLDSAELY
ncbi:hypothetical protein I4U23_016970 [Adineta vaga]|nr:hypothetical protein I4U23_016970 [Adineta vaga]